MEIVVLGSEKCPKMAIFRVPFGHLLLQKRRFPPMKRDPPIGRVGLDPNLQPDFKVKSAQEFFGKLPTKWRFNSTINGLGPISA